MMNGCGLPKKYWPEAVLHANYLRNLSPVDSLQTTPFEAATGRIPDLSHFRVFGCKVWYRQGSQARLKTLVDDKAIPGTLVGFEGAHVVRILNEKGRIIRASATHFQEEHTGPPGAKRQRVECLEQYDIEMPTRTAWFTDPDLDQTGQTSSLPTSANHLQAPVNHPQAPANHPEAPAMLPTPREHEPSASAKRDFNLRSQNNLLTAAAAYTHLAVANTFAMIASMVPEEPYEPKSWKDAMLHNG